MSIFERIKWLGWLVLSIVLAIAAMVILFFIMCCGYIFIVRDHDPAWLLIIFLWAVIDLALFIGSRLALP